jgi:DNA-binding FrmR family transcriptional regulator
MNDATKQKVQARIRRIAGQLEGVTRMIEDDRSSVDVLLQIASAQAALGQAGKVILRVQVETSISAAIETGEPSERKQRIDELMEALARYGALGRG